MPMTGVRLWGFSIGVGVCRLVEMMPASSAVASLRITELTALEKGCGHFARLEGP
jgi:hypothetical protein